MAICIMQHMCFASWITEATDTCLEYVMYTLSVLLCDVLCMAQIGHIASMKKLKCIKFWEYLRPFSPEYFCLPILYQKYED